MCNCSANDICKESKRQTINAEDVFKALEEIEFPELIEPLKASLEGQLLFIVLNFFDNLYFSCHEAERFPS